MIRTAASTYADGNWYRVEVTRSTGEASMRVSPINGSNPEIIPTPGPTGLIPEGITIYFGGVNLSR